MRYNADFLEQEGEFLLYEELLAPSLKRKQYPTFFFFTIYPLKLHYGERTALK